MKKMKRFLVALLSCLTAVACVAGISACGDDGKKDSSAPAASSSSSVVVESSNTASSEVVESSSEVADSSEEAHVCEFPVVESLAATCEEDGYTIYGACECGVEPEVEKVDEAALGHDTYYVEEKEPTCTERGHASFVGCYRCGQGNFADKEAFGAKLPVKPNPANFDVVAEYVAAYEQWFGEVYGVFEEVTDEYGTHEELVRPGYVQMYADWVEMLAEYEATGHDWDYSETINKVDATCLTVGYEEAHMCMDCGFVATYVYNDWNDELAYDEYGNQIVIAGKVEIAINPENHAKLTTVEAKTPDCLNIGWAEYEKCDCGYTTYEEKAALGHFYVGGAHQEFEADAPDCTNVGYEAYKVCVCGYNTITEKVEAVTAEVKKLIEVPALGHDMYRVVEGKAPSCADEANGYTAHTKCDRENCGYEEASVVVNYKHTWNAADATCTEDKFCTVCKKVDVTAYGHDYGTNVTSITATCYQEGLVVNKCACGEVQVFTTGKLEHTWAGVAKEATKDEEITCQAGIIKDGALYCVSCANDGIEQYANSTETKDKDGNVLKVSVTLASNKKAIYVTNKAPVAHAKSESWTEPTCYYASTNNECKWCNEYQESFFKAALGHQFTTNPTCLTTGKCTRANCDIARLDGNNYSIVPAYNHEYTQDTPANKFAAGAVIGTAVFEVPAKAATCAQAGYDAHYECYLCKDKAIAEVDGWTVGIGANDNNNDIVIDVWKSDDKLTNTNCYFYVAPIGHDYKAVEGKIATCEEAGYTAYEKCSVCGNEKGKMTINKTSHASTWTGSCLDKVLCDCSTPSSPIEGWTGCGEYFANTKKGACVMNEDGYCVVCGECEHNILKDICPTCKKDEPEYT